MGVDYDGELPKLLSSLFLSAFCDHIDMPGSRVSIGDERRQVWEGDYGWSFKSFRF